MIQFKELFEKKNSFLLIAGPCAIESEKIAFEIAEKIHKISQKLDINFVFKGSFHFKLGCRMQNVPENPEKSSCGICRHVSKSHIRYFTYYFQSS